MCVIVSKKTRYPFLLGPERNDESNLILGTNPPKGSIITLPNQELMINKTNYPSEKPIFNCILLEEVVCVVCILKSSIRLNFSEGCN